MTGSLSIWFDVGDTKIEAVTLAEGEHELARRRIPAPFGGYRVTLTAITDLVGAIKTRLGRRLPIGAGIPAAVSPATGADIVFGAILGTGVGGGVIAAARVLTGANAIAGESDHNPLPRPTPYEQPDSPCYCGQRGCIETFPSGPGLADDHAAVAGDKDPRDRIVAAAGFAEAEASPQRYERRLDRALASFINLLDPDAIGLGSSLSKVQRWYRTIPMLRNDFVFSVGVGTKSLAPVHRDADSMRGAARLWPGSP